uniref:Uncharacterized protein n=1 Tax=Rhizophora mucronata TaxID=61149 RepID=A0A2P2QDY5_RHIMU
MLKDEDYLPAKTGALLWVYHPSSCKQLQAHLYVKCLLRPFTWNPSDYKIT